MLSLRCVKVLVIGFSLSLLVTILSGCANRGIENKFDKKSKLRLAYAKVADLQSAYLRDPKSVSKGVAFAIALRKMKRSSQAVNVLSKLVVLHPKNIWVRGELGKALVADGQFERAKRVLLRSISLDVPDVKLLSAYGVALQQLGHYKEARKVFRDAIKINPGNFSAQANLGMSYVLDGQLVAGEKILRQAASFPSADATVRRNWAIALTLLQRKKEAINVLLRDMSMSKAKQLVKDIQQKR